MADEDVFQRLMAKQAELERMRRAIQELQSLDDAEEAAPAVAEEPEEPEEEEEEEGGMEEQQKLIATLLQKRDELLRMQVKMPRRRASRLPLCPQSPLRSFQRPAPLSRPFLFVRSSACRR